MKTVKILEDFTGYPNGTKRVFVAGETPELSNDFADLIVGKGHAREEAPRVDEDAAPKAPAKQERAK